MNKHYFSLLFFIFFFSFLSAQQDSFYHRLRAINNSGIIFYNVDGVFFTKRVYHLPYTLKNMRKVNKHYGIKRKHPRTQSPHIKEVHKLIRVPDSIEEDVSRQNAIYIIKNNVDTFTVYSFGYYGVEDADLELSLMSKVKSDTVPDSCFDNILIDSTHFAGRQIDLQGNCRWMDVNNLQCPSFGQMNWSYHKTIEGAQRAIKNQFLATKNGKTGKIIRDEEIEVYFEGVPTKARKIVYDIKGFKSLLLSASGTKELNILYIACPVRGYNVSAVYSYWNNDSIDETGFPPLLSQFIKLR